MRHRQNIAIASFTDLFSDLVSNPVRCKLEALVKSILQTSLNVREDTRYVLKIWRLRELGQSISDDEHIPTEDNDYENVLVITSPAAGQPVFA
jgi:hypothetical protein